MRMKSRSRWFFIVVAILSFVEFGAAGSPSKVPQELIGTWDYTAMTALKNGKPFGTVHFQPGRWVLTLNEDGTWVMKPPSPPAKGSTNGTFEVHGHDVEMKQANGNPFQKYRFKIEQDGRALTLTTKESTITASREK